MMLTKTTTEQLLTEPEVREILRLSHSTFFERLKDRSIPTGFRIGGKRYWRLAALEAWIADQDPIQEGV